MLPVSALNTVVHNSWKIFALQVYATCFGSRGNLIGKKTYDSIGKRPFTGRYLR